MSLDPFGVELLTRNSAAGTAFASAARRIFEHRPDVDVMLAAALAADPACVGAHALRGLCQVSLARAETMALAQVHLQAAEAARREAGASAGEAALVAALRLAVRGSFGAAAEICESHLDTRPQDILLAKLAHAIRFMAGDTSRLAVGIDRALAASGTQSPGYGFLLGCRAFALEEQGAFSEAERMGRHALDLEPLDAWAIHAVGHVHEMTGRVDAGLAWIEAQRPVWSGCNNFALHMSWHAALFHMERGAFEATLDLYDREIWPRVSEDFRDMCNAVALLFRLDVLGVDVAGRWEELADLAARRRRDRTLVFASLHHLIALVAAGRHREASELVEEFEQPVSPDNDQEQVLRLVGRGLARALLDATRGAARPEDIGALLRHLPSLGGSAAQRDLFMRALAELAINRGDLAGVACILATRRRLKRDDRYVSALDMRLRGGSAVLRLSA